MAIKRLNSHQYSSRASSPCRSVPAATVWPSKDTSQDNSDLRVFDAYPCTMNGSALLEFGSQCWDQDTAFPYFAKQQNQIVRPKFLRDRLYHRKRGIRAQRMRHCGQIACMRYYHGLKVPGLFGGLLYRRDGCCLLMPKRRQHNVMVARRATGHRHPPGIVWIVWSFWSE